MTGTNTTARMAYLHALTPVHSGTGQAASVIDLPIAREKATGWPLIPASGLKGVLRAAFGGESDEEKREADAMFGTPEHGGALCFTDQRILCLPVRSFFGTFAYVTCPLALRRFARDAVALGAAAPFVERDVPEATAASILVAGDSVLGHDEKVYLEDLDLAATPNEQAASIANGFAGILFSLAPTDFTSRFAIVSDDVFALLSETATEITARVKLEADTKTVVSGGLWYEEAVPAEAIFAGAVVLSDAAKRSGGSKFLAEMGTAERYVQLGGKASVGRGLCRFVLGGAA